MAGLINAAKKTTPGTIALKPVVPGTIAAKPVVVTPKVAGPNSTGLSAVAQTTQPGAVAAPPAATATAPTAPVAAAPNPGYTQKDADTMSQVSRVIASDSPLMKQARTAGLQVAARRGLLSSSMAANASQDAVLTAATPIGSQTAAQNAAANLSNQEYGQTRGLNDQTFDQQKVLTQISEAGLNSRLATQIKSEETRLGRQLTSAEKIATADRVAATDRLDKQIKSEEAQLGRQLTSAEKIAAADRMETTARLDKQIKSTASEGKLDRASQQAIAGMNLDSADQERVSSMVTTFQGNYESALANINANTNLSAKDRTAQVSALNARRDKQLKLVRQLYDVDISWPADAKVAKK